MAATSVAPSQPALDMKNIGMRFGESWVLRHVDFQVARGAIHALVGHNGAGKSTLMKIALGGYAPTEGSVYIAGHRLTFSRPAESRQLGLGMVLQERSLVRTLTGLDNVFLNAEAVNRLGLVRTNKEMEQADELCDRIGLRRSVLQKRVSEMSPVEQELVEIVKALRLAKDVLVLDEPTAPLTDREIKVLFRAMRNLAESGSGIVLITHHLGEVFEVSDEVTTLREGSVTLSVPTSTTSMDAVINAMLGSKFLQATQALVEHGVARAASDRHVPAVLELRNLGVGAKLHDVSLEIYPGEVVGIAGLAGSGRTTLLRTVFGDIQPTAGKMLLNADAYAPRAPGDAIHKSVYLIPEERGKFGLVLTTSIMENTILQVIGKLTHAGWFVRSRQGRDLTKRLMRTLAIRARGPQQVVGELSGGNQQKVVLSKALAADSSLLLLDEPTFGVDVGAAGDLIHYVRGMVDRGRAALWVTSDIRELIEVSDRILVMVNGTIQQEIPRGDPSLSEAGLIKAMQRGARGQVAMVEAGQA